MNRICMKEWKNIIPVKPSPCGRMEQGSSVAKANRF